MTKNSHRCVTVTLSIAQWGRMVQVTGPRGVCGKPYQSDDHDHILDYVASLVRFETYQALLDLDEEDALLQALPKQRAECEPAND